MREAFMEINKKKKVIITTNRRAIQRQVGGKNKDAIEISEGGKEGKNFTRYFQG